MITRKERESRASYLPGAPYRDRMRKARLRDMRGRKGNWGAEQHRGIV